MGAGKWLARGPPDVALGGQLFDDWESATPGASACVKLNTRWSLFKLYGAYLDADIRFVGSRRNREIDDEGLRSVDRTTPPARELARPRRASGSNR